jgi:hypothetical protein
MTVLTDADLYLRGARTPLASWEEYARGAAGAAMRRSPGVAVAVFPNQPERAVYNNALLERDLVPAERADALDAMEAAYAAAGVTRYAAWVHESDRAVVTHQAHTVLAAQEPELQAVDGWDSIRAWMDRLVALRVERQGCGGCAVARWSGSSPRPTSRRLRSLRCPLTAGSTTSARGWWP